MATSYQTPGVYIEEVNSGPRPIEGVGTAVAAFVGFTEKASLVREIEGVRVTEDLLNKPQLVTNWSQYEERFGGFVPGKSGPYLPHAVYGYFANGGARCYVISVKTMPKAEAGLLSRDGKAQLVVQAKYAGIEGENLRVKISDVPQLPAPTVKKIAPKSADDKDNKKEEDNSGSTEGNEGSFTLIVEREFIEGHWKVEETISSLTLEEVQQNGNKQVQIKYPNDKASKWVEILVPDSPPPLAKLWPKAQEQSLKIAAGQLPEATSQDFEGKVAKRTGVKGLEALDNVTMVCVPDLMTTMSGQKLDLDQVKAVQTMMIAHCERMSNRVAIFDPPPDKLPAEIKEWRMNTAGYDSSYATLYYPWLKVQDPILNKPIHIPPCGHIAGIWARSDDTRGVHKAPANEVVQAAVGLAYETSKGEQAELNPNGINCIRSFPGRGVRVWGARTLSSDPAWRYLNVRRLFNYVETSIENGTQWVVFEPNDRTLWAKVRRDITSFLRTVWLGGALFGSTPEEAFYVKCDDELNPQEIRDQGQLIVEIGMAPVKPAEFVIFRFSQWAGADAEG